MEIIYPNSFLNLIESDLYDEDKFNFRSFENLNNSFDTDNELNSDTEFGTEFDTEFYTDNELDLGNYDYDIDINRPNNNNNNNNNNNWINAYDFSPKSKAPFGPPPSYTPSKNSQNIKILNENVTGGKTGNPAKYVSKNSIRFCLRKYTYIWQTNGRAYWAFLVNVDRYSVSGFRWINYRWVYFGLDLRYIYAFECY